jgi:hypothetical protein
MEIKAEGGNLLEDATMDARQFDGLTQDFATRPKARRAVLGALVVALVGGTAAAPLQEAAAGGKCGKGSKRCHRGCCEKHFPVCCKNFCCRHGAKCCGHKKCCVV